MKIHGNITKMFCKGGKTPLLKPMIALHRSDSPQDILLRPSKCKQAAFTKASARTPFCPGRKTAFP